MDQNIADFISDAFSGTFLPSYQEEDLNFGALNFDDEKKENVEFVKLPVLKEVDEDGEFLNSKADEDDDGSIRGTLRGHDPEETRSLLCFTEDVVEKSGNGDTEFSEHKENDGLRGSDKEIERGQYKARNYTDNDEESRGCEEKIDMHESESEDLDSRDFEKEGNMQESDDEDVISEEGEKKCNIVDCSEELMDLTENKLGVTMQEWSNFEIEKDTEKHDIQEFGHDNIKSVEINVDTNAQKSVDIGSDFRGDKEKHSSQDSINEQLNSSQNDEGVSVFNINVPGSLHEVACLGTEYLHDLGENIKMSESGKLNVINFEEDNSEDGNMKKDENETFVHLKGLHSIQVHSQEDCTSLEAERAGSETGGEKEILTAIVGRNEGSVKELSPLNTEELHYLCYENLLEHQVGGDLKEFSEYDQGVIGEDYAEYPSECIQPEDEVEKMKDVDNMDNELTQEPRQTCRALKLGEKAVLEAEMSKWEPLWEHIDMHVKKKTFEEDQDMVLKDLEEVDETQKWSAHEEQLRGYKLIENPKAYEITGGEFTQVKDEQGSAYSVNDFIDFPPESEYQLQWQVNRETKDRDREHCGGLNVINVREEGGTETKNLPESDATQGLGDLSGGATFTLAGSGKERGHGYLKSSLGLSKPFEDLPTYERGERQEAFVNMCLDDMMRAGRDLTVEVMGPKVESEEAMNMQDFSDQDVYNPFGTQQHEFQNEDEDNVEKENNWEQERERIEAFYRYYNDDKDGSSSVSQGGSNSSTKKHTVRFCLEPHPQAESESSDLEDEVSSSSDGVENSEAPVTRQSLDLEEDSDDYERQREDYVLLLQQSWTTQKELQNLSRDLKSHQKKKIPRMLKSFLKICLTTVVGVLLFWWATDQLDWMG